ncbi:MAG: polysaccharide biosynthesis protein [Bacteroidales bacterium]|nr:polysaccharide biosynthesis protein [Bacteroidales bacterium]
MKPFYEKLSRIIVNTQYFSRWTVLVIDSLIATFATLCVFILLNFLGHSLVAADTLLYFVGISLLVSVGTFYAFGTYRGIMRHTTIQEILRLSVAAIVKSIILLGVLIALRNVLKISFPISDLFVAQLSDMVLSAALLVFMRILLIYIYQLVLTSLNKVSRRVLIYGDNSQSVALSTYISNNLHAEYKIMGFVKMQERITKLTLHGVPVFTIDTYDYFAEVIDKKDINAIVFPSQASVMAEKDGLIEFCIKSHVKVLVQPQLSEMPKDGSIQNVIREINVEDLLGREVIDINMKEVSGFLEGKRVMVTGGAGSIGSELARLISTFPIEMLIVLDNAETPLHNIQLELTDREKANKGAEFNLNSFGEHYKFVIADVRDAARIDRVFDAYRPQIVFHAAAYKHVPLMENNPCEAINVNVLGSRNVADMAVKYEVEKMVMVSTDKAVNPTNVMGCSKRLAEIYVQTLSRAIISGEVAGKTKFVTTRFGNVLGSNGSVIPRFKEQIIAGGPVTVTHKDIIRYFMTIPEACRLVLEAATMGNGYEIFVFDMGEPVKIADMARKMISLAGFRPDEDIKIEYTGLRPGEKLYEELLNSKENTIPTEHQKISVAKVREYVMSNVLADYAELKNLVLAMDKMGTVKQMKAIVPEFKSKNSIYEQLDKPEN